MTLVLVAGEACPPHPAAAAVSSAMSPMERRITARAGPVAAAGDRRGCMAGSFLRDNIMPSDDIRP
jgi:hypothetical protein